ncbi:MAG: hypothetical protein AAF499_18585 [Pseudomonadota bacterium]
MTTADLFATFLDLLGHASLPDGSLDGESKLAAFTSDTVVPHDPILWYLSGGGTANRTPRGALRVGDHKLVEWQNSFALYNIVDDPLESLDIGPFQPTLLESLIEQYTQRLRSESEVQLSGVDDTPRVDLGARSMTLTVPVVIDADTLETPLASLDGSYEMTLDASLRVQITLTGVYEEIVYRTLTLSSEPLTPGEHTIAFKVRGNKSDLSQIELWVDDVLVDEILDRPLAVRPTDGLLRTAPGARYWQLYF